MDTIDIEIDAAAPPLEAQQAIERDFVENATSAGAIDTHMLEKNGRWTFIAKFIDIRKAALYAAELTNATGTLLSVVNMRVVAVEDSAADLRNQLHACSSKAPFASRWDQDANASASVS
jgi:hypothetical protein